MVLVWQELEPEEDPGTVTVLLYRDGGAGLGPPVLARTITGEPRRPGPPDAPWTTMVEVLEDPWLRLETGPDAIAAGERLEDWRRSSRGARSRCR